MAQPTTITAYRVDGSSVDVPETTAEDWRTEIANGDTICGLADWYDAQLEQATYDDLNEEGIPERSDDDRMSKMELACSRAIELLNENGLEMADDVAFALLKTVYDLGRKHRNEEGSEKDQRKG